MTKALIDFITPWLVDHPDEIEIEEIEGDGRAAVVELSVHPDDVGKVIGRRGRIIRSLRTLAKAAGQTENRSVTVEVID
jgi:predicted RNA-binding protein YlqC (UPF0109 family)